MTFSINGFFEGVADAARGVRRVLTHPMVMTVMTMSAFAMLAAAKEELCIPLKDSGPMDGDQFGDYINKLGCSLVPLYKMFCASGDQLACDILAQNTGLINSCRP